MSAHRPLIGVLGITVWTVGSIILLWNMPIGIGLIYVILCVMGWWLYMRRVRRLHANRRDDMARGGQVDVARDRPRGLGYGRHSWGSPDRPNE